MTHLSSTFTSSGDDVFDDCNGGDAVMGAALELVSLQLFLAQQEVALATGAAARQRLVLVLFYSF